MVKLRGQELKIFTGNGNPELAREICAKMNSPLGNALVTRFSDGEINVQIVDNVRGMDVFVVQPTSHPVNRHFMELLIMIDALKRASAARITAVLPYYGYARQDRKVQPRVPITAKLVADLITTAGANRVLTVDLHAAQIQGFFNIPVDNLFAAPVLLDYIKSKKFKDLTVVSPDAGGVERARAFAKRLGATLAIIDKRRDKPNVAQVMNIVGDVEGHDCLLLDDMVDTAGTLTEAAAALRANSAGTICAACTHAVLSGPAIGRINESALDELIVTNTIPMDSKQKECPKLKVLSVGSLIAEAITRIHEETSLSSLFV
ncbi:MAG: phosphoribosylpyrophosphate synthetase [Nitrospirae bacterium GWC2_57_13]|jgi:ribose-phosphate pyrophosphokinase|nr:MAG: phosphoribosylpyrophosphate synthetase [Nitrospirae bacterium GWC2_57_13]OGW46581.1 MAG: phosphoribosylpyrophosphate synthetase [Nitrospirae bacterium GWD2_57_8]